MPIVFRSLLAILCCWAAASPARDMIKPRALSPGDTIALVAPARAGDPKSLPATVAALEKQGFKVKVAPNALTRFGYLAGTDQQRADAFMAAVRDPEVDAIFCITGGFGVTRMMDLLDYDEIRRQRKIVSGFSDITGLHLAIAKKSGLVSLHAPTSPFVYQRDEKKRPFANKYFWRTVLAETYTADRPERGWTIPADEGTTECVTLVGGKASGRLIGGNLSLVAALMGTPYEIETEGRVLFLEDVNEEPYRVDRMLSTLRLAGKLDKPAAVVLGMFSYEPEKGGKVELTMDRLMKQYFDGRAYPVIYNFPVGHVENNATMPVGVRAEVDGDARTVRLLEDPLIAP